MKDFEFYKTIRLSNKKDKIMKAFSKLHNFYKKIPNTKGCMENINADGGACRAWCCRIQTPQFLYSEFLLLWDYISKNWDDEEVCNMFEKCMLNAVDPLPSKGCVFFDEKKCICNVHKVRPYNCFLPDSWVYTKKGPMKIKNILAGHEVYGKDGRIYKVKATISSYYEGMVYDIKYQGNSISSWCTEDHKWYVDNRKDKRKKINLLWKKTKDLTAKKCKKYGDYLLFPYNYEDNSNLKEILVNDFIKAKEENGRLKPFTGGKNGDGDFTKSLPLKIKIDDEFLFMLGIYLAEGCSSIASASFSMNIVEKHHLLRIEKYINSLGISCSWPKLSHSKKLVVLRVGSCLFARFMAELGGKLSNKKRINKKLFEKFSFFQLKKIYDAWNVGDGRKKLPMGEESTITISELLALQMNFILVANNIFARIYKYKREDRGFCSYDVHVFPSCNGKDLKKGQGSKIIKKNGNFIIPLNNIKTKYYKGPVIDIQVADSKSFITSSGVVHNCRIYGITPNEEFEPRYLRLKEEYKSILGAVVKPQCKLVSTIDDKEVTKEDTDAWWAKLVEIERFIGIPKDMITDAMGGSYRTPHDHVLLYNMPENLLNALSGIKKYTDEFDKKRAIKELVQVIKNVFNKS